MTPDNFSGLVRRAETAVRRGREVLLAHEGAPRAIKRDLEDDFALGYGLQLFFEAVHRLHRACQRGRKTFSERVRLARCYEQRVGKRSGLRTDLRPPARGPEVRRGEELRDAAARAGGFGSTASYRRACVVVDSGNADLIAAVDAGRVSLRAGARLARGGVRG